VLKIVYTLECHCGEEMYKTVMDLSNPQEDGSVVIDVELGTCQEEFTCNKCGCSTYTGDLMTETEPDECPED
jgi:hypothetical protein